jgi:hypothetical protein
MVGVTQGLRLRATRSREALRIAARRRLKGLDRRHGIAVALRDASMLAHIPSLAALESNDDGRLAAELRFGRLRSQVAVVRAVADQIEHLVGLEDTSGLGEQLTDEMAQLGRRLLEAAGHAEDSGVFERHASFDLVGLVPARRLR